MDAERLVEISRGNIPAGRSQGRPKRRWSALSLVKTAWMAYNKEGEDEEEEEEDYANHFLNIPSQIKKNLVHLTTVEYEAKESPQCV